MRLRPIRALALLLAVAIGLLAHSRAPRAEPAVCRIGINVESLDDLDPVGGSFGADLWLWSWCPSAALSPLRRMEFSSARPGLELGEIRGRAVGDGHYEARHVKGVFRHAWDMRRFPFDQQRLAIPVWETEVDGSRLRFTPDSGDSFLSLPEGTRLGEWRVGAFALRTGVSQERSSYGLPEAERSDYAWVEARIELRRAGLLTFVKLTLPVLAAAFFAVLTLFLDPRHKGNLANQLTLLLGVLFSVIINFRRSDDVIGDVGRLTLVAEVHLVTILLAVVLAGVAVGQTRRTERGLPIRFPDWPAVTMASGLYLALIAALVSAAATALKG